MQAPSLKRVAICLVISSSIALSCSGTTSSKGRAGSNTVSGYPGGSTAGGSAAISGGASATSSAPGTSVAGSSAGAAPRTGDKGGAGTSPATGGNSGSGGPGGAGGLLGTGGRASGGIAGTGTPGGGTVPASGGTLANGGANSGRGGTRTGGVPSVDAAVTGGTASGGQISTGPSQSDASASSGCGKPGAVTGAKTGQTITVAGRSRTYVVSVPTAYTGNTPLALVLVWHGANLSGSLARQLFNLESKSNGAAIFVYPDGLPMGDGGMTGWDLSTGSADFEFFKDLVATFTSNYCIDTNRIFSTGHSMGAMMTNILGCSYGDVLRAIAPASGTPPGGGRATCTGKVGALIAHGENDPTVSFSQGEASRDFWIAQNGCSTETKTWAPEPACVEYQGCQPDLPVVWCVHDEGHSWPSLTFGCDRDAGGICFDGGSAIWAFFSSFH